MSITLLRRNVVIEHTDLNPFQKNFRDQSYTGIDYITQYVNTILKQPASLPGDRVFVIRAGTGSGKSTTLPPALIHLKGRIAVSVPRRAIAEEVPTQVVKFGEGKFVFGENVGFQTSLVKKAPKRGLLYTTPGTLLQQIANIDSAEFISKYGAIFIDEVHQHPIVEDFLLARLKSLIETSYKVKNCPIIVLMSATLDPLVYMKYFGTTHFIDILGLDSQPIEEIYPKKSVLSLQESVISTIKNIPVDENDTLVFLPTVPIIKKYATALSDEFKDDRPIIMLYGDVMDTPEVRELFVKEGKGRIILGTNAVQEGVTLPFLGTVIDSGLALGVSFNPTYSCTVLRVGPIFNADAKQRRGRVGRVKPGVWYPQMTEDTFNELIKHSYPEIYTKDFSTELLQYICSEMGAQYDHEAETIIYDNESKFDPLSIPLIYKPPSEMLLYSLEKLYILGMVDPTHDWKPTYLGLVCSQTMQMFTMENKKSIFSCYILDPELCIYMLMFGCMSQQRLGRLPEFEDLSKLNNTFFEHIGLFQIVLDKMNSSNLKNLKEWFEEQGLDIVSWMHIADSFQETIETLAGVGIFIKYRDDPIWTLDNTQLITLKHAFYEGYRLNLCRQDLKTGICTHLYKKTEINFVRHNYINENTEWFLIEDLVYAGNPFSGEMNFSLSMATKVCPIDDLTVIDPNFLY